MISTHDKLHCVERELKLRHRVYDRLVDNGKMTPEKREREIELMEAIASDYRKLAEQEQLV